MLLEELSEGRDRNIEGIGSVMLLDSRYLGLLLQTAGGLEMANAGLWLDIDVILECTEGVQFGVVEEATLLEEERSVELSGSLR